MGSFIANVNKIAAGIPDGQTLTDVVTEINTLIEQKDAAMDARVEVIEAMPLYSDEERLKLAGIEQGATANDTNVELRDRSTHTGTQSVSTITETDTLKIMTDIERTKLAGIADNANAYVHPLKHSASIIDGTGFEGKVVKVDGSGSTGFDNVTWGEIVGKPSSFPIEAHTHTGMDIDSLDWSKIVNEPSEYPPSNHHHDITDVVTGDLSATRITETQDLQFVSGLERLMIAGSEQQDNKGIAGGYVPLDINGKIPSAYIPSTAVVDTFVVDSESAMLGIPNASAGDIAIRSDLGSQFVLKEYPASILANWVPLITSSDVLSVNGKTGVVSLVSGDITEAGGNLFYTAERVQNEIAAAHDAVGEFTNKTIDSHLNKVGANHIHYKVKALENLAVGDVVKIAGYQNGEDAIRVVKTTSPNDVAIGVVEHSISNGAFGLVVNTGTVDGIDTSAWTFGTILYHNGNGGLQDYLPTSDMYQACAYVMRVNAGDGSLLVEFTEPRVNYVDADLSGLVI